MLGLAFAVLIVVTNLMVVQLVAEPSIALEPDSQLAILGGLKGRSLGGLATFEVR